MGEDRREDADKAGIKVVDRRQFTATGERRPDAPELDEDRPTADPPPAPERAEPPSGDPRRGFEHRPVEEPEGVDFSMLVNAMATQALMLLGEIPHPDTGEPVVHLDQARLQIDMLELLRVKCRGNLDPTEERLLDEVLYQLRMRYVAKAGTPG